MLEKKIHVWPNLWMEWYKVELVCFVYTICFVSNSFCLEPSFALYNLLSFTISDDKENQWLQIINESIVFWNAIIYLCFLRRVLNVDIEKVALFSPYLNDFSQDWLY